LFETKGASKEDFAKVAAVINTEIYSVRSIKKLCPSEAVKDH